MELKLSSLQMQCRETTLYDQSLEDDTRPRVCPKQRWHVFYDSAIRGVTVSIPIFDYKAHTSIPTACDNTIGVKAARLWNNLPQHVNPQTISETVKKESLCGISRRAARSGE